MERFILAKHWHYFIASFALPLILFIFGWYAPFHFFNGATMFILIPLSIVVAQMSVYLWLWSIGKYFKKNLPNHLSNKFNLFKWFVRIPVFLILSILVYLLVGASFIGMGGKMSFYNTMGMSMYVILPLWIVLLISKLFCIYYISRVLQSLHSIRSLDSKFIFHNSEFILILFFPVGIWFLQPRVNNLFIEIKDN